MKLIVIFTLVHPLIGLGVLIHLPVVWGSAGDKICSRGARYKRGEARRGRNSEVQHCFVYEITPVIAQTFARILRFAETGESMQIAHEGLWQEERWLDAVRKKHGLCLLFH